MEPEIRGPITSVSLGGSRFAPSSRQTCGLSLSGLSILNEEGDYLVKDLNISVRPGSVLAIIGDEGVGKSTLLKAITGMLPEGFTSEGTINVTNPGYLEQILHSSWKDTDVYEYFFKSTPEDSFEEDAWNRYNEVTAAIANVNLDPDIFLSEEKTIGTLSGGEQNRLQLAKLMFENRDVLLLDEPTNHLDLDSILWLEEVLTKTSSPVIVVSHDEMFLESTADQVLYLQRSLHGKDPMYRLNGNGYQEFLAQFDGEASKAEKEVADYNKTQRRLKSDLNEERLKRESKARKQKPQDAAEKGRKLRGLTKATQQYSQRQVKLEGSESPERIFLDESIKLSMPAGCTVPNGKLVCDIEIPELRVSDRLLATNLKFAVTGPEKTVIIGENGSGKTTFIKRLKTEIESQTDGGLKVGYLPQNYQAALKNQTTSPLEFLSGFSGTQTEKRTLLANLNLSKDDILRPMSQLSGGQIGKTILASLVLSEVNVLLMDEPTNNLYPLSNRELRRFLSNFPGALIAISHDRQFISEVATRVCQLTPDEGFKHISVQLVSKRQRRRQSSKEYGI